MDTTSELPTIRATELAKKATIFANEIIVQLNALNEEYPTAQMSQDDKETLEKNFSGNLPGPRPQEFISVFERLFFAYMASRFVIVP
jgi:hypothetical protein